MKMHINVCYVAPPISMSTMEVRNFGSPEDAWVVGNEPVVVLDFRGMIDCAKQKE